MVVKNYISNSFPRIEAYTGVNLIGDMLSDYNYLVVFDNETFMGILTHADLVERPHKLVVDCLSNKTQLNVDDRISTALEQFSRYRSSALPVFENNQFMGIVEKQKIISSLFYKIDELYQKSLISEQIKTHFLKNLSHEIRSPMNAIVGFLNIISELKLDEFRADGPKHFEIVKTTSDHFLQMFDDLVQLALIKSGGEIKIKSETINLESLFFKIKNCFEDKAKAKKLFIRYLNPDKAFAIQCDYKKIHKIFYHLIDNAIKFSEEKGHVCFGIEKKSRDSTVFFVTNNTSKIAFPNTPEIFVPFTKLSTSDSQLFDGLGIGLSIVQNFLGLLGGKIWIDTSNANETTFRFSIPKVMDSK